MTSPRQFFNSLVLTELDAESANYITNELLADARLDLLPDDTDEFTKVVELIQETYPKAIGEATAELKAEKTEVSEPSAKPDKALLQTRLKNLKKMLAKNPSDAVLNGRIKNLTKMITKG